MLLLLLLFGNYYLNGSLLDLLQLAPAFSLFLFLFELLFLERGLVAEDDLETLEVG